MNPFISKKKQHTFYIMLCFAMLCWLLLFVQIFSDYAISSGKESIPAFIPKHFSYDTTSSTFSYSFYGICDVPADTTFHCKASSAPEHISNGY